MRIGIDFDNTLVNYERVFAAAAVRRGLIPDGFAGSKRALRDAVRGLPGGEHAWQCLQAEVYGARIAAAVPFPGVHAFFERCHRRGVEVFIVSHKTRFGHHDPVGLNLRAAAIGWMAQHRFFDADGFGIPLERVYFESQRAQKLDRIRMIGCTHFIDDLEEVLTDPRFPDAVNPILLAADGALRRGVVCADWRAVGKAIFDA